MKAHTQKPWAQLEWFARQMAGQSSDETTSYFGHAINGYQLFRHQALERFLRRHAGQCEGAPILDIGCGTGELTARIADAVGSRQVVGLDFVPAVLERARSRYPEFEFRRCQLPRVDAEESAFGLVVASEVLYYLTEKAQRQAVREIARTLHPGGYVLFSSAIGRRYFTMDSAADLLGAEFDILDYDYLHMSAYHMLTRPFLLAGRLEEFLASGNGPADADNRMRFERWRPWLARRPAAWTIKLLTRLGTPLLRSSQVAAACERCCRLAGPALWRSSILILAQKPESGLRRGPHAESPRTRRLQ